jgi:dihydroorotate dehydrogenase
MKNLIFKIKSMILNFGYKFIAKPYFFAQDPEKVHDDMIFLGKVLGRISFARFFTKLAFNYQDKILETNLAGLKLKNPVGLAAGFDKDAEITNILPAVGFGLVEVGSITGKACAGNLKPRLWRLPKSNSLVVYYGLKNKGCEEIVERLKKSIAKKTGDNTENSVDNFEIPVGFSVAMTNIPENANIENAINDYAYAFEKVSEIADYITVNISCPNITCGEEKLFLVPENLEKLLTKLDQIKFANIGKIEKPIFVKMSPDLELNVVDEILNILDKHRISGIICTNLTKKRDPNLVVEKDVPENGGLSGAPVREASDKLLTYLYKKVGHRFVLIGCGGIFSAKDAYRKIRLGASAVQLITGMIYVGPQLVGDINRKLATMLKKDGFKNVSEAVGIDNL